MKKIDYLTAFNNFYFLELNKMNNAFFKQTSSTPPAVYSYNSGLQTNIIHHNTYTPTENGHQRLKNSQFVIIPSNK
jgi:predicted KAP-like P-loop ATPase